MSKELTALRMDFKDKCPNIKVKSTLEASSFSKWFEL